MNSLTTEHLTTAMAALIDERKLYEYYGPHLVDKMSLEEMRVRRTQIDEAINALGWRARGGGGR